MPVARETLYEEVWAEPMTTVAKRYDVSSNFLARVCEQLNVPRPARGYWAQVKAGQRLPTPTLPRPQAGDPLEWARDGELPKTYMPPPGAQSRRRKKTVERPSRHPLLIAVREYFDAARVSREGYLKPYKHKIVDIFVSKETLKRALDIANDLFLKLEERGHRISFQPPDAKYDRAKLHQWDEGKSRGEYYGDRWHGPQVDTIALVGGVGVGLTLFEISAEFGQRWDPILKDHVKAGPPRHPKPGEPYDWQAHSNGWFPSGRLGLRAYAAAPHIKWDRYWRETKSGEFASTLDIIAKDIEHSIPAIEKLIAKHEREAEESRRRYEEQRRGLEIKEAERQRVEREAQREKEISETLAGWRTARDVRAYVAEVNGLVKAAKLQLTAGGDAEKELNWMLSYADRIDPLTAWRTDIARVKAVRDGAPCSKCGKVHGTPEETDGPAARHSEGGSIAPTGTAIPKGEGGNEDGESQEVARDP